MPLKKIIAKGNDVRLFSSILGFSIIHVNIAETEYPIIYNDVYSVWKIPTVHFLCTIEKIAPRGSKQVLFFPRDTKSYSAIIGHYLTHRWPSLVVQKAIKNGLLPFEQRN